MNDRHMKPVLCLGEALVDIIMPPNDEPSEHVGGSPLNVACGLGNLGHDTFMASWWGGDDRGRMIENYIAANRIWVVPGSSEAEKTAVAYAKLNEKGQASYEFDLEWQVPELPDPNDLSHLHTGSFAATMEPGGSHVLAAVKKMALKGTVSYDPNIRPSLMGAPGDVRNRIEEIISLADVVKASDEDIAWLYGKETPVEQVMRRWLASGPGMVLITRGPWGAYAMLAGERDMMVIDPLNVEVVDTVGAGDSFMAGLLSGLLEARLLGTPESKNALRNARWNDVITSLHRAVITSGLTVSRSGPYSPSRDEVIRVQTADPYLF